LLGEHSRSESMFYYVRMEELVPENHLLRLIDNHLDLSFVRDKVKHLYSYTGRPSIDPEVLLRMLLIGYLYGITSERRLCEDVKMHIGYRWFVGLSLEDAVPDHSTFSKNRHDRFQQISADNSNSPGNEHRHYRTRQSRQNRSSEIFDGQRSGTRDCACVLLRPCSEDALSNIFLNHKR